MRSYSPILCALTLVTGICSAAHAQLAIPWSTIDGGGGTSSGGVFTLSGTLGQPDAGNMSGGSFAIAGGFWSSGNGGCPGDVDDGSGTGVHDGAVTIDDLLYYLVVFEEGSVAADVDNGTGSGTHDGAVTIDDLLYYVIRFEAGC